MTDAWRSYAFGYEQPARTPGVDPEDDTPDTDVCPAGGAHTWALLEEWGTGRTGWACEECHAPAPPDLHDH